MAKKRSTPVRPEPAEQSWLEVQLRGVPCPGLEIEWRGGMYAYVSVHGEAICRYGYIKEPHIWECAIWKPSENRYGGDGFGFPNTMPPDHSLGQALWVFDYATE